MNYYGGMASSMSSEDSNRKEAFIPLPKSPKRTIIHGWQWGDISMFYKTGQKFIEFDDGSGGSTSKLKEEDIRRLHSFLSQWIENNSEDYI